MFRIISTVSALSLLAACSGDQPFDFGATATAEPDEGSEVTTEEEAAQQTGGLDVGVALPEGSTALSPTAAIFRFESPDEGGGGLVQSVTYNQADDSFTIDNLGFDGANVYTRTGAVDTLGENLRQYAVYDADDFAFDALDGDPILQNGPYRAIVGVSKNAVGGEARTSFAIVRTGGYAGYGFGGFIYERNGSVTLPVSGQAHFDGEYAGARVYGGAGGLEFTTGDISVDIDFSDFNANDAVNGTLSNRLVFATDGTEVATGYGPGELPVPNVNFVVVEGVQTLTENGEVSGSLTSYLDGVLYEEGTYYGIIGGDMTDPTDGGELVGVFVIESDDPRYTDITAQETGGFILYR